LKKYTNNGVEGVMKEVSKQQVITQIQSHKSKMYLENVLP